MFVRKELHYGKLNFVDIDGMREHDKQLEESIETFWLIAGVIHQLVVCDEDIKRKLMGKPDMKLVNIFFSYIREPIVVKDSIFELLYN